MMPSGWINIDQQAADVNVSSSTDSFHGDLFGDELMDIYHIVTDEGTNDDPTMVPNGMRPFYWNLNIYYV